MSDVADVEFLAGSLIAFLLTVEIVENHENAAYDKCRADACHKQCADGYVVGYAIDNHGITGRNHDAKASRNCHQAGSIGSVITVNDHLGNHDCTDGCYRCRCGTGDRAEEHAGDDRNDAETASDISDQAVRYSYDTLRDTAGIHDAAGQHEERQGQHGERSDAGIHGLCDKGCRCNRIYQKQCEHGQRQADTDGNTDRQADCHHKEEYCYIHYFASFTCSFCAFNAAA